MAYNANIPANDGFIADAPGEIRTNNEGLKTDQIVDAGKLKGLSPGNASGNIPVSNGTVNTNLNAEKVGGKVAADFAPANHTHAAATTSSNGLMANTDKAKLDGIAAGAQVNQNAFSNVLVGGTTIQADAQTDTLELVAGTNIALTPDATNDRVIIGVTGKVPSATAADTAAVCTGNAATATTFQTARTIGISGDATGTATSFNGGANITIPLTLTASGVTAGTYRSVTIDAKGRVTAGTNPTTLATAGITDAVPVSDVATTAAANKLLKLNASGLLPASITGNAATASSVPWSGITGVPAAASSLIAVINDTRASGTNGGSAAPANTWNTRVLNTALVDQIGINLSSNQFTLPAGTYEINASAPFFGCNRVKARLQNITDSTTTIMGTSEAGNSAAYWTSQRSIIQGVFTIAASKVLEIQCIAYSYGGEGTVNGYGISTSMTGANEVYTVATIRKIG